MRRHHLLLLVAAALVLVLPAVAGAAADPARSRQWSLDRIGAPTAWSTATGAGVVVAVVDSGVDLAHEDLAGRLVPGRDVVDDDDDPQDENGHGTHVAGIVAAALGNGKGVAGVAPGAKVMPIRVLGPDGGGTLTDVIEGVRHAVANGAHVVNLSLGEDTQAILGPAFGDVLDEAWAAGVVPVVSAGNQFLTGSGFSDENALVVAATNRNDGKPSYSSGVGLAKWGISAPGGELPTIRAEDAVFSTYWTGREPNQYAFLAGTSQAAPHVSAAVAILLSTGRFTPAQAVQRLLDTAADIGSPGRDSTFGAGRLDLGAALAGLRTASSAGPAAAAPAPMPKPKPSSSSPRSGSTAGPAPTDAPSPAEAGAPTSAVTAPVADSNGDGDEPADRGQELAVVSPTDDGGESTTFPAVVAGVLAAAVAAAANRQRLTR